MQELYTIFKEKHPNVNIEFSKFCTLRPKWCVWAGSKMTHSVCVCSAHQTKFFVASWCNRLGRDTQRPDQEDHLEHWEQQMHDASVWILFWHCNSEEIYWSGIQRNMKMMRNLITVSGEIIDQATSTTITATYKEYKKNLINVIDDLIRHSYIAKLKITSSWYRMKSNSTTGIKNTASYSVGCILLGTRW